MINSTNLKKLFFINKKLILIVLIIGQIGALTHYKLQSSTYSSNVIFSNANIDQNYLKELVNFKTLDSSIYNLPTNEIATIKASISDLKIKPFVENTSYIKLLISSKTDRSNDVKLIQNNISTLLNNNKYLGKLKNNNAQLLRRRIDFAESAILRYTQIRNSLNPTKDFKITKKIYKLKITQLVLKDNLYQQEKFHVISPVQIFTPKRTPLSIFIFLYTFLSIIILLIFSKRIKKE